MSRGRLAVTVEILTGISIIEGLLQFPDNVLFWETGGAGLGPGFREWVDEIRAGSGAGP